MGLLACHLYLFHPLLDSAVSLGRRSEIGSQRRNDGEILGVIITEIMRFDA